MHEVTRSDLVSGVSRVPQSIAEILPWSCAGVHQFD